MNEKEVTKFPVVAGIYIPGQEEPIFTTPSAWDLQRLRVADTIPDPPGICEPSQDCTTDSKQYPIAPSNYVTENQINALEPAKIMIEQKILPSSGTKLVCTQCGTQNWHTLILRRKAGLIEGLCKQEDGSGCYPLASRRNCQYTYSNLIDCPQLAEYQVAIGKERRNPTDVCRDHVGEMLRQGPLYQIWPLED